MVFGAGILEAFRRALASGGDYRHVLPLLAAGAGAGSGALAAATQAAFVAACDTGSHRVAAVLLQHAPGLDGNAASANDVYGNTVLAAAAKRGAAGVVRALVASGKVDAARCSTDGLDALIRA